VPKQRLGVVLLVPQPLSTQIDGIRRGLGDGALGRIPPHVTLVPPVNVNERDLPGAFDVVRSAAAGVAPIQVRVGPVATFQPVNPVAYLAVSGDDQHLDALDRLRDGCLASPLDRPQTHEFVPHVTVADELAAPRIDSVVDVLADFDAPATFDRVHVLAERPGRVWVPVADAPLGAPPGVVGRGSLPVELSVSGRPDLEAASLLAVETDAAGSPFAVTARRDGAVVGAAWGWTGGGRLELADIAVAAAHRGQGLGRHVLAGVEDLGRRRSCSRAGASAPADGAIAALLSGAGWALAPAAEGPPIARRRWERVLGAVEATT
jgi:2'-5' RNA ligase/GNAT superfamily N-acetyltransferase